MIAFVLLSLPISGVVALGRVATRARLATAAALEVLIASFPSAGSNSVLAQRFEAGAERISAAIVLSNAIGAVTVPLVAWLMLRR